MSSDTDRIEQQVMLRAPLERVWRAISDAQEFGSWFGVRFERPFEAGRHQIGRSTPTTVDPEVAKQQAPHAGLPFKITVDRIEPMRLFSFRWHPYAVDPEIDYSKEPTTLVTFELEEIEGGTRLTITESGFDGIPLARRAKAMEMNAHGWEAQRALIGKYLEQTA